MNVQGNAYTFLYASAMVLIVAAVLAFTAQKLQPIQERNVEIEKKQNILASIEVESTVENAEKLYDQYITDSYVIDSNGQKVEGEDAFNLDLKKELDTPAKNRKLPVFKAEKRDSTFLIFPTRGKGLWGPIWGYVALMENITRIEQEPDYKQVIDSVSGDTTRMAIPKDPIVKKNYNAIYGVFFDHKGETPGLGAEISTKEFQAQFKGKKLFDEKTGEFISIRVYKGGEGAAEAKGDTEHGVDAISGGTITSNGLEDMLYNGLENYVPYLKKSAK